MATQEERMALLRAYCRIDADDDQFALLAPSMLQSAEEYMVGAGVSKPADGTARRALYDECVNALVLDAYDNRGAQFKANSLSDNPAFRRKLVQLKLSEPEGVPDSDTDGGCGA